LNSYALLKYYDINFIKYYSTIIHNLKIHKILIFKKITYIKLFSEMKNWNILQHLIPILFPNYCVVCGVTLKSKEEEACPQCIEALPQASIKVYISASNMNSTYGALYIELGVYMYNLKQDNGIEKMLHAFKYRNKQKLGQLLSKNLAIKFNLLNNVKFDCIIPMPLYKDKLKTRGYNQSLIIAKEISNIINIPINSTAVIRHKNTFTQTNKCKRDRYKNLKNAFTVIDQNSIKGKHILMVDDVITTGATLQSLGKELMLKGAGKISFASLAKASI
jgi:ComF family protein